MKIVIGLAVVAALAVAAVVLTGGSRAAGARDTLEDAAARFVACYDAQASYLECKTGTSKVNVATRTKNRFTLVSAVEFGPHYVIERERGGELQRGCSPSGSRCPVGRWRLNG
jgi:predicted membrane-bound mannosyltransferase